jgi:glycosyltransferase involved in cell wall biosynthesis
VDDGSTDRSRALLQQLKSEIPALRVIALTPNSGQSAAFEAGISRARGEVIVLMDSDLQNDPRDIAKLLSALEGPPPFSCAAGLRARRQDNLVRRVSSRIANAVRIRLTGDPIRDTGCSLKAFRAELFKRIKFFRGMHRFLTTLVRLEGGTVIEVEVNHRPRPRGRPKYGLGLGRTFTALRDAFAVRWMRKRCLRYRAEEL